MRELSVNMLGVYVLEGVEIEGLLGLVTASMERVAPPMGVSPRSLRMG